MMRRSKACKRWGEQPSFQAEEMSHAKVLEQENVSKAFSKSGRGKLYHGASGS